MYRCKFCMYFFCYYQLRENLLLNWRLFLMVYKDCVLLMSQASRAPPGEPPSCFSLCEVMNCKLGAAIMTLIPVTSPCIDLMTQESRADKYWLVDSSFVVMNILSFCGINFQIKYLPSMCCSRYYISLMQVWHFITEKIF